MSYGYFKDVIRQTDSDKILHNKAFNITKNAKQEGYQRGLASMAYTFFDKKTSSEAVMLARSETLAMRNKSAIKNGNMSSKELAEELHKLINGKFEKKVNSLFMDNIQGADLADI